MIRIIAIELRNKSFNIFITILTLLIIMGLIIPIRGESLLFTLCQYLIFMLFPIGLWIIEISITKLFSNHLVTIRIKSIKNLSFYYDKIIISSTIIYSIIISLMCVCISFKYPFLSLITFYIKYMIYIALVYMIISSIFLILSKLIEFKKAFIIQVLLYVFYTLYSYIFNIHYYIIENFKIFLLFLIIAVILILICIFCLFFLRNNGEFYEN